ncbi:unnamed protein product [Staurois parvus]|uniref:Uncharacterized protein n=1 Tax=Staurois parvus TaxID=386267 RepID=A0ABN9GDE1_9NEOB|nr:unnamed protein product [Staurois parvus]
MIGVSGGWNSAPSLVSVGGRRNSAQSLVSVGGRKSAPSLVSVGVIMPHHWYHGERNSAPSLVSVGGGIVPHRWCQWEE